MGRELFTKDFVSSYHPSYEADLYDVRPKLKRIDGLDTPHLQARVRQDTKESLKQEALDRLRHIAEYRILQTGFVRVGKYLCLGALLPPYFLLVRLPFLLLRAGNQIFQQIAIKMQSTLKNGVDRSKKLIESIQFMQRVSHLLKTVIKLPSSVWGSLKEQSRTWFKSFFSLFHWPKIPIPSWPNHWKMDVRFRPKNHFLSKLRSTMKMARFSHRIEFREKLSFWFQTMRGLLHTRSLQIATAWKKCSSCIPKEVQVGWNLAFMQAQAYLQHIVLLGEKILQTMWKKRDFFSKNQNFSKGSGTGQMSKMIAAVQVSWQKIQNGGSFILDGWRILFLACIALLCFVIEWGIGGVFLLWARLPVVRMKKISWLKVPPQLQWSNGIFSWLKRSFSHGKPMNLSVYTINCYRYITRSFSRFSFGKSFEKIPQWNWDEYVKLGFRFLLISFLMSCIATLWAIQAIDQTCSKKFLRNLCFPFFNKS